MNRRDCFALPLLLAGCGGNDVEYKISQSPIRTNHLPNSPIAGYGEGEWIPDLGGNTTYFSRAGRYVILGKTVFLSAWIYVQTIGTGSTTVISGVPFPAFLSADGNSGAAVFTVYANGIATAVVSIKGLIADGSQIISLYARTAASTAESSVAIFGNNAAVLLTGFYRVQ